MKRARHGPAASSSSPSDERFVLPGVAIFAVAFLIRLVHIWQIRDSPFFDVLIGDSRAYDLWAREIAAGDWVGHEVFYQAPLYPYFLGILYSIFGRDLLLVRICQAVIGSLAAVLLGLAGSRFFSRRVGIIAGLALALYAPAIFFDGLLQKSVLDVFFICLMLWLLSRSITKSQRTGLALSDALGEVRRGVEGFWLGLTAGALSLTRENALVFIIVILIWIATRPIPSRARLNAAGVFLLGLAMLLVPVGVRNSVVGGGFYLTTSQFGPNLFIGNNPRADGTYMSLRFGRGAPEYERQDATELAEQATGRRLTPGEVSSYWTDRALTFITGQPVAWLKLVARKIALVANATEMVDTESQESYAEWSLPVRVTGYVSHFGVLVPLAFIGIVVTWPERSKLWVLLAMLGAYAASVVLFYVFARYRYPLVPFLLLFAAAGVVAIRDVLRASSVRRATTLLAGTAALAIVANWPILSRDLMRAITENNLATVLQAEGRTDAAADHYRRAIAVRPDYAPAHNNLGTLLRADGALDEAIAQYQRALAVQPDYPSAHYNLANALLAQGKAEQAIHHFRQALQSMPGSVEAHTNLGIALEARGDLEGSLTEFREAVRLDPTAAKTHRNLGSALAAKGALAEAVDYLRRAIDLDPSDASSHYELGNVLLEGGKHEAAADAFRAAIRLTPESVDAHNNLGIALASLGKLDEAIGEFQQALKLKPELADARRNLEIALNARRQMR